jgi:RimJ/RimL family protein N-acetyltransferase
MNQHMSCANAFPTLQTRRMRLVVPEARHYQDFAALHTDPYTMRYVGQGMPLDRVEAWLQLAMLIGHWQMRGYGVWIAEDLDGRFIGRVGLFHPDDWDEPELNWMIAPLMRKQGLAAEAARAVLDHAFGTLGLPSVISLIRPGNEASRKVAAKLGAVAAETVAFLGGPVQIFRYRPGS